MNNIYEKTIGIKVEHKKFGEGKIESVDGIFFVVQYADKIAKFKIDSFLDFNEIKDVDIKIIERAQAYQKVEEESEKIEENFSNSILLQIFSKELDEIKESCNSSEFNKNEIFGKIGSIKEKYTTIMNLMLQKKTLINQLNGLDLSFYPIEEKEILDKQIHNLQKSIEQINSNEDCLKVKNEVNSFISAYSNIKAFLPKKDARRNVCIKMNYNDKIESPSIIPNNDIGFEGICTEERMMKNQKKYEWCKNKNCACHQYCENKNVFTYEDLLKADKREERENFIDGICYESQLFRKPVWRVGAGVDSNNQVISFNEGQKNGLCFLTTAFDGKKSNLCVFAVFFIECIFPGDKKRLPGKIYSYSNNEMKYVLKKEEAMQVNFTDELDIPIQRENLKRYIDDYEALILLDKVIEVTSDKERNSKLLNMRKHFIAVNRIDESQLKIKKVKA